MWEETFNERVRQEGSAVSKELWREDMEGYRRVAEFAEKGKGHVATAFDPVDLRGEPFLAARSWDLTPVIDVCLDTLSARLVIEDFVYGRYVRNHEHYVAI